MEWLTDDGVIDSFFHRNITFNKLIDDEDTSQTTLFSLVCSFHLSLHFVFLRREANTEYIRIYLNVFFFGYNISGRANKNTTLSSAHELLILFDCYRFFTNLCKENLFIQSSRVKSWGKVTFKSIDRHPDFEMSEHLQMLSSQWTLILGYKMMSLFMFWNKRKEIETFDAASHHPFLLETGFIFRCSCQEDCQE